MKIHSFKWLAAAALMVTSLAGCGGGGGSSPAGTTVISGTASAGIIETGTANVYAVNASGAKGALLGSTTNFTNGKYSVSLGPYSGAIEVEVSGAYTDEATGNRVTIPASNPLHAMMDSVDNSTKNNKVVAVTPLTELAWRYASSTGAAGTTPDEMVHANKLVDDLYKISDIIGIEPVRPDNASMGNASQESQAYTLALAAISKMASTATGVTDYDKMNTILTSMETEIETAETSGSMSSTASSDFATALGTVSLSTDFPSASDQLSTMGKKSQMLTLTTSGTLPAGTKIYAIEGTISLPANVSVRGDNTASTNNIGARTLSDVFMLAGVATNMGADPVANYLAVQREVNFTVVLRTGISTGDFATLSYDVMSGTAAAADFSLATGTVFVKDINGADIPGLTVTIR